MIYTLFDRAHKEAVSTMFVETFTKSEGAEEGALIGRLAAELGALATGPDVFGCIALDGDHIAGAIFMSRLHTDGSDDPFLLAPVGVHPSYQRQGVGKRLIQRGFEELRRMGVKTCVSYGDPAYYTKSGFQPISTDVIPAPHPLSMPFGWIAAPLHGGELCAVQGPTHCVAPFDDPALW